MKNKIIATVLILVTLITIFVIPASAKSANFTDDSLYEMDAVIFTDSSGNYTHISNAGYSGNYALRGYYVVDKIKPFVTTNMKDLYVFCNDGSLGAADSLYGVSPDLYFSKLEVYYFISDTIFANSVIDFDLSLDSSYFNKLTVDILAQDDEDSDPYVLTSQSTGSGNSIKKYDSKAHALFTSLGMTNQLWMSDGWNYGVTSGKGLYNRESHININFTSNKKTHMYAIRFTFDIGSHQSSYYFNYNTCRFDLRHPDNDSDSDDILNSYIEYTDNIWQNILIFFQNVGNFFQNVIENIIANFKSLPNNLKTWFNKVVTSISNLPQNIADKIGGFFGGIGESISNWFSDTYLGQVLEITGAMKDFLNSGEGVSTYRMESPNADGSTSSDTTSSDFSDIEDNEIYEDPDIPGYLDYEYWHNVGE